MVSRSTVLCRAQANHQPQTMEYDDFYSECICLRSHPVARFLAGDPPDWLLPVSSVNEDRLLRELGVPEVERQQIEELHPGRFSDVTVKQLASRAMQRLAFSPPLEAGRLQRLTQNWHLRPFPLGLRFSGKNMSPLPSWLCGAQSVALNMSNNDLGVQLHFALFFGSSGYVLKPEGMRRRHRNDEASDDDDQSGGAVMNDEDYWPPPRDMLYRATIDLISLHALPKRLEQRPLFDFSHKYAPELSGPAVPPAPDQLESSRPALQLSLHPTGGLSGVSTTLPLPQNMESETFLPRASNGLNAQYQERIHVVAAEPHTTFLCISATDRGQEVACATAVIGRLRRGYRVLQMRSPTFGTRIELCFLFLRIEFSFESNLWPTPRQMRVRSMKNAHEQLMLKRESRLSIRRSSADKEMAQLNDELNQVKRNVATHRARS